MLRQRTMFLGEVVELRKTLVPQGVRGKDAFGRIPVFEDRGTVSAIVAGAPGRPYRGHRTGKAWGDHPEDRATPCPRRGGGLSRSHHGEALVSSRITEPCSLLLHPPMLVLRWYSTAGGTL